MRSDYGTENCYLAASQIALRSSHTDTFAGEKSFRYGKSTTNTVRLSMHVRAVHISLVLVLTIAHRRLVVCSQAV